MITDPAIIEGYLTDASNVRGHAEGLFRPRNASEVAAVLRRARQAGVALTITAARTSTTAAPVPFGGWLLSTEQLRGIEWGDDCAVVGAGELLGAFQDEAEARGLFFPPDPTSRHDCTVGAIVACNASGARSYRYGATRPWITAAEVVLPDGSVHWIERGAPVPADWPQPRWVEPEVKTAAGYPPPADWLDLFIGMEGTLGVITRVRCRLMARPAQVFGVFCFLDDDAGLHRLLQRLWQAGRGGPSAPVSPRCIEFFDRNSLDLIRDRAAEVPPGAHAAVYCEQECEEGGLDARLMAWLDLLEEVGVPAEHAILAADPGQQRRVHELRHLVPARINEQVVRNGMPKVGTDFAVPRTGLAEMMEHYRAVPLETACFGHLGDCHLHLNMLPRDEAELARARALYKELALRAVALGGTVSAEHGIGKIKKPLLAAMVGEETLASFRALKTHLDPDWVLGRGTLFDPVEG